LNPHGRGSWWSSNNERRNLQQNTSTLNLKLGFIQMLVKQFPPLSALRTDPRVIDLVPRSPGSHATGFSEDARKGRRPRPWQWLRPRSLSRLRLECPQCHDHEERAIRRGTSARGIHPTGRRAKYVFLAMHRRLRVFDACVVFWRVR
jgi:hypothetical protein